MKWLVQSYTVRDFREDFFFFFFGHALKPVGSQFPDQGLNFGHGSESTKF